ncbi:M24 family metallopeptidase [Allofustis seminis]|uniref:M24 family metallopeptidase n=1 Tax=Allofustis seminis TaxID=166939 RepID=UPI000375C686|nr:Xaa-Pro peptidase family protein [Allofustis seminis]
MRVQNVQKKLVQEGLDAILITSPYNLRYVSNFTGTTGLSVITQEKAFFVTDFRYMEQAAHQAKGFEIVQNFGPILDEVKKLIAQENIKKIGFEADHVIYNEFLTMKELFDAELVGVTGFVEELRLVKDPTEVETIRQAIRITEIAYRHILDYIQPGMTEIQVANELERFMKEQGASSVSFDTIVASGKRSAMPHGVASEKEIEMGDMITIDFGCYYKGYVSDMTRTFALGDPGEELKEIYQIVHDAHRKAALAVKPGMTGAEIDAIARDYIKDHGYGEYFGHGTGHGIGLEIHEGPTVNATNNKPLVPGNVITVEPGIYISGLGGVRLEDDILVTEDGHENLMVLEKDFLIKE